MRRNGSTARREENICRAKTGEVPSGAQTSGSIGVAGVSSSQAALLPGLLGLRRVLPPGRPATCKSVQVAPSGFLFLLAGVALPSCLCFPCTAVLTAQQQLKCPCNLSFASSLTLRPIFEREPNHIPWPPREVAIFGVIRLHAATSHAMGQMTQCTRLLLHTQTFNCPSNKYSTLDTHEFKPEINQNNDTPLWRACTDSHPPGLGPI